MRVLSPVVLIAATLALMAEPAVAALLGCGVTEAVVQFHGRASDSLVPMPSLDADVDNCFNPSQTGYIRQTHQTFASVSAAYRRSLQDVGSAYQALANGGPPRDFESVIVGVANAMAAVSKPIFDNASSLKNYGFTTSDAMDGGQYRYPLCNSAKNDGPAELWARFYGDALALRQINANLVSVAACLK